MKHLYLFILLFPPLVLAMPEADLPGLGDPGLEDLGNPDNPPNNCLSMNNGRWYGDGVEGAEDLDDQNPIQGDEFAVFDNPGGNEDDEEPRYSVLSQRIVLPAEVRDAADDELVTLLASFQVNLPPNTYAKGRVRLIGVNLLGQKVQEETVASFRPDHLPNSWEKIDLRDYRGLDLDPAVRSIILEIGFTADYPDDAGDEIALVDDVRIYTHTVTEDVTVDTSDLATDGVIYITGTPQPNLVWCLYDEANSELKVYRGPILVETVDTTDLKQIKAYLGRKPDAFFLVDTIGARFANVGQLEVYLHSGSDLGASSISLNEDQFSDLEEITEKMEELQGLLIVLSEAYELVARARTTGMLRNQVGPQAAGVLNDGYQKQLAFKEVWDTTHGPELDKKIKSIVQRTTQITQLLEAHEAQMEVLLEDDGNNDYDSSLEALQDQWEAAIDALEDKWEEAEFAVSDEGPNDEYDRQYPDEDATVTPLEVQLQIAELEERLENLDDLIDKDEDAHEGLRDNHLDQLEHQFLVTLDKQLQALNEDVACITTIGETVGDEETGEAATMLQPFEADAAEKMRKLEEDVQKELQAIFAKVGRISHDVSAENNFGRVSMPKGTTGGTTAKAMSDPDPDELGDDIFGVLDDISDIINDWVLPEDVVDNPAPLDCSEGHPAIDKMAAMVFGMAGVDVVVGTINNDLLSGGGGEVDLIIGLNGNDVLRGAEGVDIMLGMGGDDFLHAGDGVDVLFGDAMPLQAIFPGLTPGNDCLEGEDGIDFIFGEPGNDNLDGGFDYDLLVGGAGNDRMFGDAHNDLMIGWKGDDTLLSDATDNQKWSNIMLGDSLFALDDAGKDELYATKGNELSAMIGNCNVTWLFGDLALGGEEDDLLEGEDGIDVQFGGQGVDTINGREHVDIQFGGRGDDVIQGHRGGVAIEITVKGICVPIRLGNIMFGNRDHDEMHGGADMDLMFGNDGEDKMFGNDGSFHILSLEHIRLLGDWIFAGDGNDRVDGMYGSDKIFGGPGEDHLDGDDGFLTLGFSLSTLNDIIFGGPDNDVISGGLAPDIIFGNSGNDEIRAGRGFWDLSFGNRGNDSMWGERGIDIMFGNLGEDQIRGGRGIFDLLFGNRDNDRIWGERGIDLCYGNDGDDLIWGGRFPDLIWGDGIFGSQAGDDEIWGERGQDIIFGNNGDDLGHGGDRMDVMFGNLDNDCFEGNDGNDLIFGNRGDDQLCGQEGKDRIWGDNSGLSATFGVIFTSLNEPGNDVIWGGPGHDRLRGGPGDDLIYGEGGNDKIHGEMGLNLAGLTGNDTLFGGPGKDKINGQNGEDKIYGGLEKDRLKGGRDADLIYGGSGNNKIQGNRGNDTLYGGCDDDRIKGGLGNDLAFGGPGRDRISGKAGSDRLVGAEGDDRIRGGRHNDQIFADGGADVAKGGWGDDIILGGTGDDKRLKGGPGADRIHGGSGADRIKGNAGKDILDTGNDTVRDRVIGGLGKDVIYADRPEDKIRRKKELVSNSSDDDSGIDSSITRPTPVAAPRLIYGCKWEDSNGDGIRQPDEKGIENWPIFADLNGNMVRDPGEPTTRTGGDDPQTWPDDTGCYCLEIPGSVGANFTIQEFLDDTQYNPSFPNSTGTHSISADFCLYEGEVFTGVDFGNVPVPRNDCIKVSGRKWYDLNGDGKFQIQDEDKYTSAIVGTIIWADFNGNGVRDKGEPFTRVDEKGNYCFKVPAGQRIFICEEPSSNNQGIPMMHTFPSGDRPCHVISADGGDVTVNFGNKAIQTVKSVRGRVVCIDNDCDDPPLTNADFAEAVAVLDLNGNNQADEGEPRGKVDPKSLEFRLQTPNCLPPGQGTRVIMTGISDTISRMLPPTAEDDVLVTDDQDEVQVLLGFARDTDEDGLSDCYEMENGLDPKSSDTDRDQLTDYDEVVTHKTSPLMSDTDQDGLSDREELAMETLPHNADTDGDGVSDGYEARTKGLDPHDPDSDDDGLWDGFSRQLGLLNGMADRDQDGASNYLESYVFFSDPSVKDSDGDGFGDFEEAAAGFSAMSALDNPGRGLQAMPDGRVARFQTGPSTLDLDAILEVGEEYCLEQSTNLSKWTIITQFEATERVNFFSLNKGEDPQTYLRVRKVSEKR